MLDVRHLHTMERDALLVLAKTQGVHVHHRAGKDLIIQHIIESMKPQKQTEEAKVMAKREKVEHHNTKEQVEEAIKAIKDRRPQFEALYNDAENTVHFRCAGAEECVNLDIPLRVIVMKASNVSKGKRSPRAINDGFDTIQNTPKNAYTGNVLAI